MTYSCHSDRAGQEPRGRTVSYIVQDGYRTMQRGEILTREPVMRRIETAWIAMKCGALKQAGRVDENCMGCANDDDR